MIYALCVYFYIGTVWISGEYSGWACKPHDTLIECKKDMKFGNKFANIKYGKFKFICEVKGRKA